MTWNLKGGSLKRTVVYTGLLVRFHVSAGATAQGSHLYTHVEYMAVCINYCSQNGGSLLKDPYCSPNHHMWGPVLQPFEDNPQILVLNT